MPTKGSVLVVDDNTDCRELITEYLRLLGYRVSAKPGSRT